MNIEVNNINEIQGVIMAYAKGDFSKRLKYHPDDEGKNIIVAEINMLGEELMERTVTRDYFSSIYDAISEILIITDLEGNIQEVNRVTIDHVNKSGQKLIGRNVSELFYNSIDDQMNQFANAYVKTVNLEAHFIAYNRLIPVSGSISCIYDAAGKPSSLLFIATDITENLQHDRDVLKATIEGQERERRRLADDLHDSLGQELNGVMMYLNTLQNIPKDSEEYDELLSDTRQLVHGVIKSMREISYNLMPAGLNQGSLSNAVKELARRINCVDEDRINLKIEKEDFALSTKKDELLIFRVIQEFINNSIKHGEAGTIDIIMRKPGVSDEGLFLSLRNDGKPFDVEEVLSNHGLNSIMTRLKALNAKHSLVSNDKVGTILNILINER